MADDILNFEIGITRYILYFSIGQNKEYLYKSCFHLSLIDYYTTKVRELCVAHAKKQFDP